MNTSGGLKDAGSINYSQEPGAVPVTTNHQSENVNGAATREDVADETAETSRLSKLSISALSSKASAYSGEKNVSRTGRRKKSKEGIVSSHTTAESGTTDATRLSKQGSFTTQQQPQLPQRHISSGNNDDDGWTVQSDISPGAIHEGMNGHRSTSVDNLRIGDSSRALHTQQQPAMKEEAEGEDTTAGVTTVQAQLARDPEEMINEARRQWEMDIVRAQVVAVGSGSQQQQPNGGNHGVDSKHQENAESNAICLTAKIKIGVITVLAIIILIVVVIFVVGRNNGNGNVLGAAVNNINATDGLGASNAPTPAQPRTLQPQVSEPDRDIFTKQPTFNPINQNPTSSPTKSPTTRPTQKHTDNPTRLATDPPSPRPNDPTTRSPTPAPVLPPTRTPTRTPVNPPTRTDIWAWIDVLSAISSRSDLEDPSTPQYKAVDFLTYFDSENLDPNTTVLSDLLQRYVIVVLFFSTAWQGQPGNGWSRTDSKVCEWDGVECDNNEVVRLKLST